MTASNLESDMQRQEVEYLLGCHGDMRRVVPIERNLPEFAKGIA
jgi:hypothetical protein